MDEHYIASLLRELASGKIPRQPLSETAPCAEELRALIGYLEQLQQFSIALANGDLSASLSGVKGSVAGSMKALHAGLRHLTWQAQQIAAGDFTQRVDFMGEFSVAFNAMVDRLALSRTAMEAMNRLLQEENMKLHALTEALRESEERFRLIAENVNDVIWTLDPSMTFFTYISPSIAHLLGVKADDALHKPMDELMTEESARQLRTTLSAMTERCLHNPAGAGLISNAVEIEQRCQSGIIIHVEVVLSAIIDSGGVLKEFVGISRDISERKKAEEVLRYQSSHDALTGLYNRAYFDLSLEKFTTDGEFPLGIIAADLDGLKRVNDTYGHDAGDQLIRGAAEVLRRTFRGNDIVARMGGDEFAVLLPHSDLNAARRSLQRIQQEIVEYNREEQNRIPVSMSLGCATAQNAEEVATALKEADTLMYADKLSRRQQRA
ncbi:sensor domain-containing diguanylate cyclase [Chrysiogenes arsenatis]|uniref:sensor domain-containing diguanylate cyclase n=1 Tax=Chrysiogenes arsenatis TaxID=309797 RepID=UPI00040FDBCB|nr:diguanylate cyclase [Chrysiogenes arsenatis]